jgi:hypothetical protein
MKTWQYFKTYKDLVYRNPFDEEPYFGYLTKLEIDEELLAKSMPFPHHPVTPFLITDGNPESHELDEKSAVSELDAKLAQWKAKFNLKPETEEEPPKRRHHSDSEVDREKALTVIQSRRRVDSEPAIKVTCAESNTLATGNTPATGNTAIIAILVVLVIIALLIGGYLLLKPKANPVSDVETA